MTKKCGKCKEFKELDRFNKDKSTSSGLQDWCKDCQNKRNATPEAKRVREEYAKTEASDKSKKKYRDKEEVKQSAKDRAKKPAQVASEKKRQKSPERKRYHAERNQLPEIKIRQSEWTKLDRKNDPGKYAARASNWRAKKLLRTPKWLTKKQFKEIKNIYTLCEELQWLSEGKLHVDHIIPLQGENVSGLHVPWNLQILNMSDNSKKSNNSDGTYDNEGWKKAK